MRKTRKFSDYLIESLKDPQEAKVYLDVALQEYKKDHDTQAFLLALRDLAEARGGLTNLAKETKLNRQNLYRTLSNQGNPQLDTLSSILNAFGLRLSIERSE